MEEKTHDEALDYRRLSKTVAHALRHEPHVYELELDEEGWTDVATLLGALRGHAARVKAAGMVRLVTLLPHQPRLAPCLPPPYRR